MRALLYPVSLPRFTGVVLCSAEDAHTRKGPPVHTRETVGCETVIISPSARLPWRRPPRPRSPLRPSLRPWASCGARRGSDHSPPAAHTRPHRNRPARGRGRHRSAGGVARVLLDACLRVCASLQQAGCSWVPCAKSPSRLTCSFQVPAPPGDAAATQAVLSSFSSTLMAVTTAEGVRGPIRPVVP